MFKEFQFDASKCFPFSVDMWGRKTSSSEIIGPRLFYRVLERWRKDPRNLTPSKGKRTSNTLHVTGIALGKTNQIGLRSGRARAMQAGQQGGLPNPASCNQRYPGSFPLTARVTTMGNRSYNGTLRRPRQGQLL